MEARNSGLLISIRTKSTHPLGYYMNVDGKVITKEDEDESN